jgi:hypothetical protein
VFDAFVKSGESDYTFDYQKTDSRPRNIFNPSMGLRTYLGYYNLIMLRVLRDVFPSFIWAYSPTASEY